MRSPKKGTETGEERGSKTDLCGTLTSRSKGDEKKLTKQIE